MRIESRKDNEHKATTNQINKERTSGYNVEETTTFWFEFNKALEYIYFGETCDENNHIKTSLINLRFHLGFQ